MKFSSSQFSFESKRFRMRLYKSSDYSAWRAAHLAMLPKQNEFDEEKKSEKELSLAEFRKFLKKNEDFVKRGVIYHFAAFEKKTGRLIGMVLIALPVRFNVQSARLSYGIFNNYWKHGFAKELVMASAEFAFRKLKLHRLEAEIQPHNIASISVAKAVGFQYEGMRRAAVYFNKRWNDHVVYSLIAEDLGVKNTKPSIMR
jgi:ribosomal-protein-alanine N-acetyltransferase